MLTGVTGHTPRSGEVQGSGLESDFTPKHEVCGLAV